MPKQFTATISTLKTAILTMGKVVVPHPAIQILNCVKFDISDNKLTLTASDLETTLQTSIDVKADDNFAFCFEYAEIIGLLNRLSDGAIEVLCDNAIIQDGEKKREVIKLNIKTPIGKSSYVVSDITDFPSPTESKGEYVSVPNGFFEKINTASDFPPKEHTTSPWCVGVLCDIENEELSVVSTDCHMLYIAESFPFKGQTISPLIPVKGCKIASFIFQDDNTQMAISQSHICFKDETTSLFVRLLDMNYGKYRSVLPTYETYCDLSNSALTQSVSYTMLTASKTTKAIRFELSTDAITVTSADVDYSKYSKAEAIQINSNIPDYAFSLNGELLIKILRHMPENIQLWSAGSPSNSIIIRSNVNKDLILQVPLMILN